MGTPNVFESVPNSSTEQALHTFSNDVSRIVKSGDLDRRLEDQNLTYKTDLVEMTDGTRYWVSYNFIESDAEREKDPADKQFPGSNIMVIEGTAFTTKNGGFYKERHDALALRHHRPSMIVGVQQNYDRMFQSLPKTAEDQLAIHAFLAASFGYDQDYATSIGTSRGGMLALLMQKRAALHDLKMIHTDAMVPCLPTPLDTLRMLDPRNLKKMLKNELKAIRDLEREFDEMRGMLDTLDVLTIRGIIQELKETIALVLSNIAREVGRSESKDDVGDITVQTGDGMSFAHKWAPIYKDHPNMRVDARSGGGHITSVSKPYFNEAMARQEAIASVLHADPANRKLGGATLRSMIDAYQKKHLKSA